MPKENWIETVININKDKHDPIKPNSKSQILSERYSNITPEISKVSNSSTAHMSLLSNASKFLTLSPISKIAVIQNETRESLEMFSIDKETSSSNAGTSLRSTRKQINRALTSLNKSKTTEILFEGHDDSMVDSAETINCEISVNENERIYTDLDESANTSNSNSKKTITVEIDDFPEKTISSRTLDTNKVKEILFHYFSFLTV